MEIVIEYVQELEVSLCSFWKFTAYSTISPRYLNDVPDSSMSIEYEAPNMFPPISATTSRPTYTWSFQVTVRSSKPISYYNSTSHQLAHISMTIDKKQALFELDKIEKPNKDFVFLYATEKLG